jgi:hypothetical protein
LRDGWRMGMAGWRLLTGRIGQDLRVSSCNRARSTFNQSILLVTNPSKRPSETVALPDSICLDLLEDGIAILRGSRLTLLWATMPNNK